MTDDNESLPVNPPRFTTLYDDSEIRVIINNQSAKKAVEIIYPTGGKFYISLEPGESIRIIGSPAGITIHPEFSESVRISNNPKPKKTRKAAHRGQQG